jgi:peptidyl-tRNA hydrolase, PTH1 family
MKILIGLGNIGNEYTNTRHNAGFLAVDFLQSHFNFSNWTEKKDLKGFISEGKIRDEKVILLKPNTLMNNSGEAVSKILHYYKLTPADIVILHDDLDITSGTLRETLSSRSAGNNGVQSIIDHLGTQDFRRIRIGIGRPAEVLGHCEPSHDYVLRPFLKDERASLDTLFEEKFTPEFFIH